MKIEVKHLSCSAGKKQILRDVSAVFEGNQIYGIIGPNGSGKTTLLRHIYREIPSDGSIFMNGTDIREIPRRIYAQKLAVMMQHQDMFESDLLVCDVIRTGRYPYKKLLSQYDEQDERIIKRIMEDNSLSEYGSRRLATLSGGELQRVMIARCLAQEPEAILLDEPTNHLDIRYRLELMKTLQNFDGLVIMTLHDMNLAAEYCHTLLLLKEGRITAQGSPEEIFREDLLSDTFQADIRVHREDGRIFVGV